MPHTYIVRNIPDETREAIEKKFADYPGKGQASPRQNWLRSLILLGALEPADTSIAAFALWQRARQIAEERGEDDLRSENYARKKYDEEQREYQEMLARYTAGQCTRVALSNRIASLLYYAVQIYVHDGDSNAFEQRIFAACRDLALPHAIAFALANAKFECRGNRATLHLPKNVEEEEEAMEKINEFWKI